MPARVRISSLTPKYEKGETPSTDGTVGGSYTEPRCLGNTAVVTPKLEYCFLSRQWLFGHPFPSPTC